jgi:hypothetical protein
MRPAESLLVIVFGQQEVNAAFCDPLGGAHCGGHWPPQWPGDPGFA